MTTANELREILKAHEEELHNKLIEACNERVNDIIEDCKCAAEDHNRNYWKVYTMHKDKDVAKMVVKKLEEEGKFIVKKPTLFRSYYIIQW